MYLITKLRIGCVKRKFNCKKGRRELEENLVISRPADKLD